MVVREGAGVGEVGEETVRGRPQAPAFLLRRSAEVTPTGVGIHAAGHPDIGEVFELVEQALREAFITAIFHGLGEGTHGEGGHLPAHEICGNGNSRPDKEFP